MLEAETGSSQNSRPYRASSRIARATEKPCFDDPAPLKATGHIRNLILS